MIAAGELFPQGRVAAEARRGRFDDLVGPGPCIVAAARASCVAELSDGDLDWWRELGGHAVAVGEPGERRERTRLRSTDLDGVYTAWFRAHDAVAAVVRPDWYLFGRATRSGTRFDPRRSALRARLRATLRPSAANASSRRDRWPVALAQTVEMMAAIGTERETTQQGIQSIEIGSRVLLALEQGRGPLTLSEVGKRSGLHPAKAHRYLVEPRPHRARLAGPDTGLYDLGPASRHLGIEALRRTDAVSTASAHAIELRDETGHTTRSRSGARPARRSSAGTPAHTCFRSSFASARRCRCSTRRSGFSVWPICRRR